MSADIITYILSESDPILSCCDLILYTIQQEWELIYFPQIFLLHISCVDFLSPNRLMQEYKHWQWYIEITAQKRAGM